MIFWNCKPAFLKRYFIYKCKHKWKMIGRFWFWVGYLSKAYLLSNGSRDEGDGGASPNLGGFLGGEIVFISTYPDWELSFFGVLSSRGRVVKGTDIPTGLVFLEVFWGTGGGWSVIRCPDGMVCLLGSSGDCTTISAGSWWISAAISWRFSL